MPRQKGFRTKVECPLWLLSCGDATIIPMARGKQTNPIYDAKPGQPAGKKTVHNCAIDVTASRFELGRIGNMLFLAAAVDVPGFDTRGWINIWQGASKYNPGTLYCALRYRAEYGQHCLCGSCHSSWITQGWVCELLQDSDKRDKRDKRDSSSSEPHSSRKSRKRKRDHDEA